MKTKKLTLLAGVLLAGFTLGSAQGATLIFGDDYNVINNGTGFNPNNGVNSGINPPTTRLQGTAAADVRYIKVEGMRGGNVHYITNSVVASPPGKLYVGSGINASRLSLTNNSGGGLTDFGPALFSSAATPSVPSIYELRVDLAHFGTNRVSFGISTANDAPQVWDFGIELVRSLGSGPLSLYKRIDQVSGGVGQDVNVLITNNVGAGGEELTFVFRITDAGAESTTFNSRVELAVVRGGTTNWIYDTQTDLTDLPFGWRFRGENRYLFWYITGNAYPVTVDNLSLTWISGPTRGPMAQTWTGGGADDNWSTAANWGGIAIGSGDSLTFGAPARQNNNNDISSLLVPSLTFNTGGFQLGGNELKVYSAVTNSAGNNTIGLPLTWTTAGAKTWHLAAGNELTLGATTAIDVNGDHTLLGGGTLRVTGSFQIGSASTVNPAFLLADGRFVVDGPGAQFSSLGGFRLGSSTPVTPSVAELVLSNGASFSLTLEGAACRVGSTANGAINRVIVDHSTLALSGGDLGLPWTGGATGEVVQVGGVVSGCDLNFNHGGAGVGSYSIQNGILEPRQIARNAAGGSCTISFDNAILRTYSVANNPFMAELDVAEIKSGGLTLDATTAHVVLLSPFSGAGALTKSGWYTATLTGANTYAGNTVVQEGKLVLPTTQTNAAAIQVADGAQFGAIVTAQGSSLTAASLSVAGAASTLSFDLGALPTPTAPLVQIGTLSASGTVTVDVTGGSIGMTPGTITLLKWTTLSGAPSFVQGTLPSHITANLVVNPGSLDLVVTGVKGYRWTGATDNNWDTFTVNWSSLLDNTPSAYTDGYNTEFRDEAATGSVNVGAALAPGLLSVNNTNLAYTLTGGNIQTPLFKKSGPGSLTRVDGADTIGTLELNEGSYVTENSSDATFASLLTDTTTGLGTFVKQGAGILTVASTNTSYDGAVVIRQGTLKLNPNSVALGSTNGSTTIENGASLDVANVQAPHEPVFVSGEGVGGQGAIVNNTLGGGVQNNLTDVIMLGDTTFGSIAGSRWDIRVRTGTGPGPGLRGNGYNLTKVGGGSLAISSQRHDYGDGVEVPYWHMNLGDIWIKEGSIAFEEATSLDNPEKLLVLLPGTTMNLFNLGVTNPLPRNITITNASLTCGGVGHTNIINGNILMNGQIDIRVNGAYYIFNGNMSGDAALNIGMFSGNPGYIFLNGANTFAGDTTVTNSTLAGNGSIAGNLVVTQSGKLAPGVGVGTLTVAGSVSLAGTVTTTMDLAPGQVPNSDTLSVGGTLTGGGNLVVTLVAGASAPSVGEVFQFFNKGVSGFASISLPDLSAYPGLVWDANNLAVNGSIRVAPAAPPSIGTVSLSGSDFVFSGTGGVEGGNYYVLTSTNVAAPMATWVPVATNVFGPGGSFSYTNAVGSEAEMFFRLLVP